MKNRISLLQQLGLIVLSMVLFIVFVVSPLINRNLNNLVSNQMFDAILTSQYDYLNNFYSSLDKGKDKQVYHIIRRSINDGIQWEAAPPLTIATTRGMVQDIFAEKIAEQTAKTANYIVEYNNQKIYYTITNIDGKENYLISFLYSDYSTALLTSIRNELVYVQYIVLIIVALIMSGWVMWIINPLNKIKHYIETIKKGETGVLNIVRGDEIGQVSNALIEMKSELDKQEKLKEEFMHNISHDLKTPIAVIKSYTESMKDDIYPYGSKEASLDVILENTDRLENKVQSFLYLNRLDYINQEELTIEKINVNHLLHHIHSQLDVNHDIIEIVENTSDVYFDGQEEHWRNVFENIIENAKRYYQEKIMITIDKNKVLIYNDGPNIGDELIREVFKPYSKGEKGNFGLGLSIVKKVVDMYHYDIYIVNHDVGVEFVIERKE